MIERDGPEIDDRFASQLERVDEQLAGEIPADDTLLGSADLEAAKRVLGLINRVRSAPTDPNSVEDRTTSISSSTQRIEVSTKVPDRIGSYEILGQVARGGMGVVFRAHDPSLNRVVALKMMLAGPFAYAEERSRFHVEAEAAAALDHPGIVPVYEVGEHEGLPFFTMGLVEGDSLAQRISEEPLKPQAAALIASQVASAVAYAHRQGVVHRDIKPSNVLLDANDRPRITDFGLARRRDCASELTATEQVLGTPSYMAPEQASGTASRADERADVYSMGATLYCMLTGRPPFQGHNAAETVRLVLDRDPIAPRQLNPAIPIDLNTICVKCLQKDPDRRYRDALALESDLQRFLNGNPIQARPIGIAETIWKWARRHPAVAALAGCCLLAAITLITGGIWYQTRLNRSVIDLQDSRAQSVRSLYRAFTNEAEYLGHVRPIGYGQRIEQLVHDANSLDTEVKDKNQLRQLLVNSFGHAGAREPTVLESLKARVTAANIWRENDHLIVGLEDGTLAGFDLNTHKKVFESQAASLPITRIDVDVSVENETKRCLRAIAQAGSQISHWSWDDFTYSRIEPSNPLTLPDNFFGIEVSPNGRHIVGLQSAPPQLLQTDIWQTRSAYAPVAEPDRRIEGLEAVRFSIVSTDSSGGSSVRQSAIPVSRRFDLNNDFLVVGRSWLDEKSIDDDLQVYDLHSDELVQSINASVGALQNVRISANGRYVACGGYFGVEVFSTSSGERIAKYNELGRCTVVSFVGSDGDVFVRNAEETLWLSARYGQPIVKLKNDQDGSSVRLTSDARNAVWVGNLRPRVAALYGDQHTRISAHNLIVETVCLSPDGQLMLSTGRYYGGNETKVWQVDSGEKAFEFIGSASTFSPDGKLIAAWNGRIQLWDAKTGSLIAEQDYKEDPSRLVFSESGDVLLAVGNFAGQSRAWRLDVDKSDRAPSGSKRSARTNGTMRPLNIHADVRKPAALSPSGRQIAFVSNGNLVVHEVGHSEDARVLEKDSSAGPDSLVFLDESRLLVVAGDAQVWNLATDEAQLVQDRNLRPPVLVSPDRSKLFCGRQLIRRSDFQRILQLPDWNNSITSASWSRDGRRVAYGLDGGDIAVWDLVSVENKLAASGFPCDEIATKPAKAADAVNAMLRVGRQSADRIHPQQWLYDCRQLTTWIEANSIDGNRVHRLVRLLAEQVPQLGTRPFFSPAVDGLEDVLDAISELHRELNRIEHVEAQRLILAAASDGLHRHPPQLPVPMLRASQIHHALGDLLNFKLQDNSGAIAAYREQSKLLEEVQSHAEQTRTKGELASDWYWLRRNQAFAHARQHQWEQASDSMAKALETINQFPLPNLGEQAIAQDRDLLKQWQKEIR